ncbi:MAG: exodeoxyribonuclease VII small subunit [Proteocatella sp.]
MKSKYDVKIQELNETIDKLQGSNMGLEESIELYKRGMELYQECSSELEKLKLSIKTIDGEYLIME